MCSRTADLKVELFGEVKLNFASETLPLERFADSAQITLLESHSARRAGSRRAGEGGATASAPAAVTAPPAAPTTEPAAAVGGPAT